MLIRAYYYTAIVENEEYSPIRPLVDWLDYNGFTLVTKPAREYHRQPTGRKRWRGDMDVEIAVDMMEMAEHADHLVLFSGDGDFRALVEAVQRKGVRVTVVSTMKSQPPMVSDDLRRQADNFVDLADLADIVGRPRQQPLPRFIQPRRQRPTTRADADDRGMSTLSRPKPPRDCPLCPRLVAYRAANRGRAPGLVQRPGAVLRRSGRAAAGRRPGARAARAPTAPGRPFTGDCAGVHALRDPDQDRLRARDATRPGPTTGWSWSTA